MLCYILLSLSLAFVSSQAVIIALWSFILFPSSLRLPLGAVKCRGVVKYRTFSVVVVSGSVILFLGSLFSLASGEKRERSKSGAFKQRKYAFFK